LPPAYAISDHSWIDSAVGAAMRIAMTVAAPNHAADILDRLLVLGLIP